jgi:hypothetical protein
MSTRIEVHGGRVTIAFDGQKTTLPAARVSAFSRVVEAARMLAESEVSDAATTGTSQRVSQRDTSPKRRSRKKVSEALAIWMADNPGWHSEEHLLDTLISNDMSDASPKRALKIALGRQRNKLFADSGTGYWCLLTDTSAGKAPRARKKAKGKRKKSKAGRKSGSKGGDDGDQPDLAAGGARVLRVKKGEDRKLASLSEAARKKRLEPSTSTRWGRVSRDAVSRAAQNLLLRPGAGTLTDPS